MSENSIELLEKLVSFDSVSRDSNLPIIEFIEAYLNSYGIASKRIPSPCGKKANLYAQIGPSVDGGVVLSGHTDVVPIDGQNWDTDPWKLTERSGKLYGRGTCDMKGFVAVVLAKVPAMLHADLKRPFQLAFSYDEEVGCAGAESMVVDMRNELPAAQAVVVGEPTLQSTVVSHKGMIGMHTAVTGHEVHSSLVTKGVSAIMVAAELVHWHTRQNEQNLESPVSETSAMFDPPITTFHVGLIEGGTAINITAKDCEFFTDIRHVPDDSAASCMKKYKDMAGELEKKIQKIHSSAKITITDKFLVPAFKIEQSSNAIQLVQSITGNNAEHCVSYGTEAGIFQKHGYTVAICGPGSIEQAHQPNEFVDVAQIRETERFMDKLISQMQ